MAVFSKAVAAVTTPVLGEVADAEVELWSTLNDSNCKDTNNEAVAVQQSKESYFAGRGNTPIPSTIVDKYFFIDFLD